MERLTVYGMHHLSFFVVDLSKFVSKFRALTSIEPECQSDGAMRFDFPNGTAFQVRQADGRALGGMAKDRRYGKPQEFKPAIIIDDSQLLTKALRGLGLNYSIRKGTEKNVIDFTVCDVLFHSVELRETEGYFDGV